MTKYLLVQVVYLAYLYINKNRCVTVSRNFSCVGGGQQSVAPQRHGALLHTDERQVDVRSAGGFEAQDSSSPWLRYQYPASRHESLHGRRACQDIQLWVYLTWTVRWQVQEYRPGHAAGQRQGVAATVALWHR